jgi:predicted RNA-binding protein with PUA-like domain
MAERRYWLLKTEPTVYSIEHLKRDRVAAWDGVRNYQARNFMRDDMKPGDGILLYHSSCEPPGVAGIARVENPARIDPTQLDPKDHHYDPKAKPDNPPWVLVDIGFVAAFKELLPLERLRGEKPLATMALLQRGQRLSVQPVTREEWAVVCRLAGVSPNLVK